MKILHTSDWHLGHTIYNDSQIDAQKDMLNQITKIVSDQQPDALIISGDVYDTTQPSADVQQMFANAIVAMHDACKGITIVCIAGNHDSGSKHMIYHTPWHALNVHMLGSINNDSTLEDYIIDIPGKGFVVAVPYAADRFMPQDVFKNLSNKVAERNSNNLPVVLSAHLALSKADWRGHDFSSDDNIGGLNCQDLAIFGDGYDYVALGHIHKQQSLDQEKRIWYSGTPIAVSFDEVYPDNNHGVLMVDIPKHGASVSVVPINIDNLNPLVNLPSGYNEFADWDKVKELLEQYPDNIASFVRLNVEVEDILTAGANDDAHQIIKDKACKNCYINSKRKGKDPSQSETKSKAYTTSEFQKLNFIEVAKIHMGTDFDDEIAAMLNEVKNMLNGNND